MGCSNAKFPTTAAADNSSPIANLLSMSPSTELTKALADGEEKITSQATEAINKVADALENAADAIRSPIGDNEHTIIKESEDEDSSLQLGDLNKTDSKTEEETSTEEQEHDSNESKAETNEETNDFIAICPTHEIIDVEENDETLEVTESVAVENDISEGNNEQGGETTVAAEEIDSDQKESEPIE